MADASEQMEIHTMETLGLRRVVVASFGNHDFDFGRVSPETSKVAMDHEQHAGS